MKATNKKSRPDRLLDRTTDSDDKHRDQFLEAYQSIIETENQQFWALYRALDVSQSDVKDLVETCVEISQSTVSRVIRQREKQALTEKDGVEIGGDINEDDLDIYPDEWLNAYQQVLAEAKANLTALKQIADAETQTDEWAAARFPELVGCHHYVERKLPGEVEKADDSHLNRLDSVNTNIWE